MMMKLRMAVGRCCCGGGGAEEAHWRFVCGTSTTGLVLKSDPDEWMAQCTNANIVLLGLTHDTHIRESPSGPSIAVANGNEWAIRMSGGSHDSRSLYGIEIGTGYIVRITPLTLTDDWTLDVSDGVVINAAYPYTASIGSIATGPSTSVIATGFSQEWLNDDDQFGSTWLISDLPSGTPGVNEPGWASVTRGGPHWDGQFTPDLIVAGGGTEVGARLRFGNILNGIVASQYESGHPAIVRDGTDLIVHRLEFKTADHAGDWHPSLTETILAKFSMGGGSSLSAQPTGELKYSDIVISDGVLGNLVPYTRLMTLGPDFDTRFDVCPIHGCLSSDGYDFFMVVALNQESTLPSTGATTLDGLVSCLVLCKVSTGSMQVVSHAVLQTYTHTAAGGMPSIPGKSPASTVGVMKGTPNGGVMFNMNDWNFALSSMGLWRYDSACAYAWDLDTEGSYITHDNAIYVAAHPDAADDPLEEFYPFTVCQVSTTTGAITKQYSGSLEAAGQIESIEGPIHLR